MRERRQTEDTLKAEREQRMREKAEEDSFKSPR
jgi:hypothetical protein